MKPLASESIAVMARLFRILAFCVLGLLSTALAQGDPSKLDVAPDDHFPRPPSTPYSYPSPNTTGVGGWDVAIAKARRFVEQLALEEKVSLTTGLGFPPEPYAEDLPRRCQGGIGSIPRVNFTGICYSDSDTGIGNTHRFATGFPPGITAASTWNRELIRARAFAIATEHRAKGVHAVLGPVLALSRTVGGGTNFEGFGADPFLIGAAGYETVIGHQAAGVQAEPKQYVGYDGQNYNRTFYSSNIDDKTLHEVEIWPYAEAIRAGAACVMNAYPYVNNSQVSQNAYLLNDVLKTHLGFQGYVQSDWFAIKAGVASILAGLDQDMPGQPFSGAGWSYLGGNYTQAVRNGSVPEARLVDAAVRIMTPYFLLGQDRDYPAINLLDDPRQNIVDAQRHRHRTVAREVAAAGAVLLKNTAGDKGLPLVKPISISLFGPAAGPNPWGPNQCGIPTTDPYQVTLQASTCGFVTPSRGIAEGTLAGGGGSGSTFYSNLVDPLSAIQRRAVEDLTVVDWATSTSLPFAAAIAQRGTVCLPFVSSFAGESYDRNLSLLHDGDNLVLTVANNCDNTIPVVQSVGPVDLEAWIDHPNVTAVIWANLGGEELGSALVDVLYGRTNPSGRLPYTIARNQSDYAQPNIVTTPQPYPQINYTEGVSIDYRGFEKDGKTPRFAFGHGLSYSNFTYANLRVDKSWDLAQALQTPINYVADAPGGDTRLFDVAVVVSFDITNDGPFHGTEIPQLYLLMPTEAVNPTKILRGFDNVFVYNGQTQHVSLYLTRKDISYWSTVEMTWVVAEGNFTVSVGASSANIRLTGAFTI